ncbi:transcriptional regulator [Lacinutrix venerupis]|nr:transcriptional regulator [Lacinutrix venerupis]
MSTIVKSHEIVCYLWLIMNIKTPLKYKSLILCVLLFCIISCNTTTDNNFTETVKISLREVGHQLLLANQDSTTLVKPVINISDNKFQVSFENTISIQPDSLVTIIKSSFEKTNLPQQYITEVNRCYDNEVAYSYAMKEEVEQGIIPCIGRELKNECYLVTVHFTNIAKSNSNKIMYICVLVFVVLTMFAIFLYKQKPKDVIETQELNYSTLGLFKFYPEQNKLIKEATEINLSKKECEILALFVAKPNQIIKREELIKKVWEDNGVVVGRSLDTYISKLRKKLKEDESIKLTNIHGVGYKLEVV